MGYKKKAFIGFDYIGHFRSLIADQLSSWINSNRVEPVFPFDKTPGGDLLTRIQSMISSSDVTLWDCTTLNPNVTFELGYAIGKRMPFFVLYATSFIDRIQLPSTLKTQWGIWYDSIDDLKGKLRPILQRNFPKGAYDVRTNKPSLSPKPSPAELDTIHVFVDHSTDYSTELQIIKETWNGGKIIPIQIEDRNNLPDLLVSIEAASIAIVILNPLLDKVDNSYPASNTLNALKMLALGIATGLGKHTILLQQGERDYSDVVGLAKHWQNEEELKHDLTQWNNDISSQAINRSTFGTRTGIPNFGKLIRRKRLNDFIAVNLFSKAFVLRTPSGYGKSCLVAQFVSENQYPVVWYTLDTERIEVADFVRDIISKLNAMNPKIGVDLVSVISSFSRKELTGENVVNYLLNELKVLNSKIVIVIDDVHHANKTQLLDQIRSFVKNLPHNVGLFVLSREDLGDEFRGLDEQKFVELKKDELEFNKEELKDYVNSIFDLSLTPDDLELLWQKSEGWIASISLLNSVIAQKGKEAVPEIISRLRGTDVKIYDYFANIVYDCFEDKIKDLLQKTSILNNLTIPAVSFLTARPQEEISTILKGLERGNSFLFNFENQPHVYRYHSLFREFLQNKYEVSAGPETIQLSKSTLSGFYLNCGEYFEAISFGLAGRNYDSVTNAIRTIGHYVVNEGLGNVLLDWLAQIPDAHFANDHKILTLKGRAEEQTGDVNLARSSFTSAQSIISSEGGSESDKLLLRLLIHQIDMVQDTDVKKLQQESIDIMMAARKMGEDTVYYGAAESYFSMAWQRMAMEQKAGDIDIKAYEQIIGHIDSVLKELSDSEISDKGIYRSQLLVSKAKVVNFISTMKAARSLTRSSMSMITHLKPNEKRAERELAEFREENKIQMDCLEEALAISKKDGMLLLQANFLSERAELASNNYRFMAMMLATPPQLFIEQIMDDFSKALSIYSKLGQYYGMAMVYNNVAATFLLLNDKGNRDKCANLSLNLSRKYSFKVLEDKSIQVLNLPTLEETMSEITHQTERTLESEIPEREREHLLNSLLDMAGEISPEERQKRKGILAMEIQDMEDHRAIRRNWCKHLEMYDTRNPLSKHSRTDQTMVQAYLQESEEAIKLYDTLKDDFGGERIAKFLYCKQVRVHSDGLEESVKSLSDKFIAKHCVGCQLRTV